MDKPKFMSKEDAKEVINALSILDNMNKKYGYPHGKSPAGIIFHAYKTLEHMEGNDVKVSYKVKD